MTIGRRSGMATTLWLAGLLSAGAWCAAPPALAEAKELRIARQLGLGYLQLYVAQERKLIEKHAKAAGLGDIEVKYQPVGTPAAMNDMLLAGNVEMIAAGVPPFILLWDRTAGSVKARGVATLNSQPSFLNTTNPAVKTIKDFTDKDRIALPSVKLSFQAITLQMAAEQAFGPGKHEQLDKLTVQLAHPDGTAALLGGRSEITAHFTSPPFQYQQLEDPRVRMVLNSYDVTGKASFSILSAAARFVEGNPKTYAAVLAALDEATALIKNDPAEASRIFIRVDQSRLSLDFVQKMVASPDFDFALHPQNIMKFAEFMHRTGSIKNKPASWKDMFWSGVHDRPGS